MNAYDVIISPTVISKCLGCNFISSTSKHLIVGKTTLLEVYEVLKLKRVSPSKGTDYKLKLTASFKLQGSITDLKSIRTAENPLLDYVLVATKSAKVSCIRWDSALHSIVTVSLHYYEHAIQNLTYEKIYESELTVAPNSKSLFCLRRNNVLVFLPFNRQDDDEDDVNDADNPHENGNVQGQIEELNGDVEMEESNVGDNSKQALDGNISQSIADSMNRIKDPVNGYVNGSLSISLFGKSVITDATSLESDIGEIVGFQFLHNYRSPTVAIISHQKHTWAGLLSVEKDDMSYTVWSLDLASESTTVILKINNLPYDIHRIITLPSPLSGSILVGCNEIIHIDSSGIVRRVALNSFVSDITRSVKNYIDQSQLELKLEDCSIIPIPNNSKVLMVLKSGKMYFILFELDGKTIKGVSVEPINESCYANILTENPGPITALDENLLFLAGSSSDSLLVEINYMAEEKKNQQDISDDNMIQNEEEDEDNLYGEDDKANIKVIKSGTIEFIKHDELYNHGPISSFTMGKYSSEKFVANLPNPSFDEVSIIAAGGTGAFGHLTIMTPTIQPVIKSSLRFSQINRLWIISNKYLITSDDTNQKSEIFSINQSYARLPAKNFINNEATIGMHELNNGKFILQVTPRQILLFNNKFKRVVTLEQQLREFDDAYIINSVFNDEFLMIFFSTGEVVIYSINTYNKVFTKIELPKLLSETIITTGYITNSRLLNVVSKDISVLTNRGQKRKRDSDRSEMPTKPTDRQEAKSKTFVLVTGDNRIVVFSRFHNEKCFQLNHVDRFSDRLSLGFFDINGADPDPFIKQVILNDLGDEHSKDEYLTILTVGGEIYSYQMYFDGENYKFIKQYELPITGAPSNAYPHGTSIERRMIYFTNVSGLTCVMVTGVVPYFITRGKHSSVKIFKFSKIAINSFVPYSDDVIKNGLIYLDTKKNARIVELPKDFNYENNLPIKKVHVGETVKSVAYHESSNTYVVSSFKEIDYNCVDEDGNPIVGTKPDKPSAMSYKGKIRLISPISWSTIDSIELNDNEVGLNVKSVALDIGSETKRFKSKKELILIGTGKYRMEDLVSNGSYRLIEVIDIIPEPGRPETNHKFKDLTQEDTKGAVTAICDVSGRFLVAQGQKIIVRDIKDNSAVSVAFMDLSVYVSEAKSFGNLVIFGDTLKSITLAGFDAEPFRMIFLGKDVHNFDVCSADFLYKDEEIFILVADNDGMLHVLQYNPEDPTSANGQRLLHKSSFNTNYSTTCMKSIPKHEQLATWVDANNTPFQSIASTAEGAMYTVFPVNEFSFRRMYILQQQIADKEYHNCGLNPRLNRAGGIHADPDQNLRPILDCELLRRFAKLNQDRMRALGQKISVKDVAVDIWKDLIEFENVLNNL